MSGFFRKVAGAFIEIEPSSERECSKPSPESEGSLDEITKDASDLLAQLEGLRPPEGESGMPSPPPSPTTGSPPTPSIPGSDKLHLTADQVFMEAQLPDGPNSAQRMLKIIAGLSMFPQQQQVVMIRAMDTADDTWSEGEVLEDARKRQSVLRRHLQSLEEETNARRNVLSQQKEQSRSHGQQIIAEIDKKIAELQKERESAVIDITTAVEKLDQELRELESAAEQSRRGITHVINALSQLITFFTGGKGTQHSPQG